MASHRIALRSTRLYLAVFSSNLYAGVTGVYGGWLIRMAALFLGRVNYCWRRAGPAAGWKDATPITCLFSDMGEMGGGGRNHRYDILMRNNAASASLLNASGVTADVCRLILHDEQSGATRRHLPSSGQYGRTRAGKRATAAAPWRLLHHKANINTCKRIVF